MNRIIVQAMPKGHNPEDSKEGHVNAAGLTPVEMDEWVNGLHSGDPEVLKKFREGFDFERKQRFLNEAKARAEIVGGEFAREVKGILNDGLSALIEQEGQQ